MTLVRDDAIEVLESEITSYIDEIASITLERDALLKELQRIKAAYPDLV